MHRKKNNIIETLLGKRFIKDDKNEIAYACKVNHNSNLKESKQYFLKEGPLALLPINNKKFSLIWSMNSSYKSFNNNQIKKLILSRLRSIFPQKTKLHLSKINYFYPIAGRV